MIDWSRVLICVWRRVVDVYGWENWSVKNFGIEDEDEMDLFWSRRELAVNSKGANP